MSILRAIATDLAWMFREMGRDIASACRDFAHDLRGVLR